MEFLKHDTARDSKLIYKMPVDSWATEVSGGEYDFSEVAAVPPYRGGPEELSQIMESAKHLPLELTENLQNVSWQLYATGLTAAYALRKNKTGTNEKSKVELQFVVVNPDQDPRDILDEIDQHICESVKPLIRYCRAGYLTYITTDKTIIELSTTQYSSVQSMLAAARTPATEVGLYYTEDCNELVVVATYAGAYCSKFGVVPVWPERLRMSYAIVVEKLVNEFGYLLIMPDYTAVAKSTPGLIIETRGAPQGNRIRITGVKAATKRVQHNPSTDEIEKNNRGCYKQFNLVNFPTRGWQHMSFSFTGVHCRIPRKISEVCTDCTIDKEISWSYWPIMIGIGQRSHRSLEKDKSNQISALVAELADLRHGTIEEKVMCTICMEPVAERNKIVLVCGHTFHYYPSDGCSGILAWFDSGRPTCPNCRDAQPATEPTPAALAPSSTVYEIDDDEYEDLMSWRRFNMTLIDVPHYPARGPGGDRDVSQRDRRDIDTDSEAAVQNPNRVRDDAPENDRRDALQSDRRAVDATDANPADAAQSSNMVSSSTIAYEDWHQRFGHLSNGEVRNEISRLHASNFTELNRAARRLQEYFDERGYREYASNLLIQTRIDLTPTERLQSHLEGLSGESRTPYINELATRSVTEHDLPRGHPHLELNSAAPPTSAFLRELREIAWRFCITSDELHNQMRLSENNRIRRAFHSAADSVSEVVQSLLRSLMPESNWENIDYGVLFARLSVMDQAFSDQNCDKFIEFQIRKQITSLQHLNDPYVHSVTRQQIAENQGVISRRINEIQQMIGNGTVNPRTVTFSQLCDLFA